MSDYDEIYRRVAADENDSIEHEPEPEEVQLEALTHDERQQMMTEDDGKR